MKLLLPFLPTVQLVARVRRRAWLNGRLIEDVVTDDLDEEEAEAMAAAAAEDGDEGGDWEADMLDDDVRGGGRGGGTCKPAACSGLLTAHCHATVIHQNPCASPAPARVLCWVGSSGHLMCRPPPPPHPTPPHPTPPHTH